MTSEITVLTKIAHDVILLQQQRSTGELVVSIPKQTAPPWRLYFYLGRLVYATGGTHPVRRWYRAVKHHAPDLLKTGWLLDIRSTEALWEVDLLNQAMTNALLTASQLRNIVHSIVKEVLFAIVGQKTITSQWNAGKQVPLQTAFLSAEQLLKEAQQLRTDWQSSGLGHLQEFMLNFSPELAIVLRQASLLSKQVSPEAYRSMMRWVQGQRSLWDISLHLQRPLPDLLRSLMPLIQSGVFELKKIPDLPPPIQPALPSAPVQPLPLIACIDDSPMVADAIEQILKPLGYEIMRILKPLQGISLLLERKPDLIFLDLVMPNTNGYELCTILRKTSVFQQTPIIILTGHDGVIDRVRAKLVGSSDFLAKPPDAQKVIQTVQKHLGALKQPIDSSKLTSSKPK